jgi:hypothetical protein
MLAKVVYHHSFFLTVDWRFIVLALLGIAALASRWRFSVSKLFAVLTTIAVMIGLAVALARW